MLFLLLDALRNGRWTSSTEHLQSAGGGQVPPNTYRQRAVDVFYRTPSCSGRWTHTRTHTRTHARTHALTHSLTHKQTLEPLTGELVIVVSFVSRGIVVNQYGEHLYINTLTLVAVWQSGSLAVWQYFLPRADVHSPLS